MKEKSNKSIKDISIIKESLRTELQKVSEDLSLIRKDIDIKATSTELEDVLTRIENLLLKKAKNDSNIKFILQGFSDETAFSQALQLILMNPNSVEQLGKDLKKKPSNSKFNRVAVSKKGENLILIRNEIRNVLYTLNTKI